MDISNQVILVTGASRGLGAATAKVLGAKGAKVVVNYYTNEKMANTVVKAIGEENAIALQADVRNKEEVQQLFNKAKEHFNTPITTVVNNALIGFSFNGDDRKHADEITWDDYNLQFQGSVQAALHTIQAGQKDMEKGNYGKIINIGTNLFQDPVVPYHDYNTSKAALLGFTRSMAKELGSKGIRVNMVSGGLLDKTDASAATPDAVFDIIEQNTPLAKVTTPEDVAHAVLFFASSLSDGITGQNLVVDGGLVMD